MSIYVFGPIFVFLLPQYYGHRAKLRLIGRENELENFNRQALRIARQVADEHGVLMVGNICNTAVFKPNDKDSEAEVRAIFKVRTIAQVYCIAINAISRL